MSDRWVSPRTLVLAGCLSWLCQDGAPASRPADAAELASADPNIRAAAYAALAAAKEAGAAAALVGFAEAPPLARELRARLVREEGGAALVGKLASLAGDSSPVVRAELASFAGRPDFALAEAEARTALLLGLARDPDPGVSALAFKGLGRLAHRSAIDGLVSLAREGNSEQRDAALRTLGATRGSGPALLQLGPWIERTAPASRGVFLVCLGASGDDRALPELLRWASDPVDGGAAQVGFEFLSQRLLSLREDAAYVAALDRWGEVHPLDAAWRRVRFELLVRVDLAAAREAAARLDRLASLAGEGARPWRARAKMVEAIAQLSDGQGSQAEEALAAAEALVAAAEVEAADGQEKDTWLMMIARIRVLSALNAALNPFPAAPDPKDRLRDGYQCYETWVRRNATRALQRIYSKESKVLQDYVVAKIFGGDATPLGLAANWNFDSAFESELGALSVLGVVLPKRGRGKEGLAAGRQLLDWLSDLNPIEFVTARHRDTWQRFPGPFDRIDLGDAVPGFEDVWIAEPKVGDGRGGTLTLPGLRPGRFDIEVTIRTSLSGLPRQLGQIARSILGDLEAAAALYEPLIIRASLGTQLGDLTTFVDASLDRAGVAMDARDGETADRVLELVLNRLDQVKTKFAKDFDEESVRRAGSAGSEALTDQARAWLDLERRLRSQALITRAVNENVVRRRPDVASGYAKKGVELDPTEFNRVLLACYFAREGNAAQARALLRDAPETQAAFYNLACTYALLGEAETALHYLERDFQQHADAGGLERQRAWARKDPDLRSLADDPRFVKLVGSAPASRPAGR